MQTRDELATKGKKKKKFANHINIKKITTISIIMKYIQQVEYINRSTRKKQNLARGQIA